MSVPVLSVQMTVVSPRVSTAESRLTSAFRRAMRWVAMARESVTVGQEPLRHERDHHADGEDEAVAHAHAEEAGDDEEQRAYAERESPTRRVTRSSSRSSGLRSCLVRWARSAIWPNLVAMPVSVTRASPAPAVT